MFNELELPAVSDVPRPPSWLNATAKREWRRLVPLLAGAGILTEPALGPLAVLCALHGDLVKQWRHGLTPTAAMVSQYRAACGDFAMTPASRSRATPIGFKSSEPNRFARFGKPADKPKETA